MYLFLLYLLNFVFVDCSEYLQKEYVVSNKTIVVTGGAQGIGYAIADIFLSEGAKSVIILDIDVPKGKQAAKQLNAKYGNGKAIFLKCDVTKDLKKVFNRILRQITDIDILVNNAGFVNEFCVKKTIETIALATIQWSLKFLEHVRKDKYGKGGTIINIASVSAHNVDPLAVVYKSAKYAVLGFTKSLGHEYNYQKTGVRVVVLCPGVTDTGYLKTAIVWDEHRALIDEVLISSPHQSADAVGRAALQVYKKAKTGTSWDIIGGRQPVLSLVISY